MAAAAATVAGEAFAAAPAPTLAALIVLSSSATEITAAIPMAARASECLGSVGEGGFGWAIIYYVNQCLISLYSLV